MAEQQLPAAGLAPAPQPPVVAIPPPAVPVQLPGPGPLSAPATTQVARLTPLVLRIPDMTLQFGRLNSTRRRVIVIVDPSLLERVLDEMYTAMTATLNGFAVPFITRENFIRMCRTLIAKRLQDIMEWQNGIRPANLIQIVRVIDVPQPLAELLYSFGPYFCQLNGKQYYYGLIPRPDVHPPNWWQLDPVIVSNYRYFIDQCRTRYMISPFPKMSDMIGQPIMLTARHEDHNMSQVRAYLNCATPADGFLRFVHEEFYTNLPFTYDDCDLIMTPQLYTVDVINAYVRSYIIEVHG